MNKVRRVLGGVLVITVKRNTEYLPYKAKQGYQLSIEF